MSALGCRNRSYLPVLQITCHFVCHITQWDLVCSQSWLVSLSQSVYMAGYMTSMIIFGQLSDRYVRLVMLGFITHWWTGSSFRVTFHPFSNVKLVKEACDIPFLWNVNCVWGSVKLLSFMSSLMLYEKSMLDSHCYFLPGNCDRKDK